MLRSIVRLTSSAVPTATSSTVTSGLKPHKIHAVRLVKSPIRQPKTLRATLEKLKLKKLNHVVLHKNTPMVNGMIEKVIHLVEVKPLEFRPDAKTPDGRPFLTADGIVLGASEEDFLKSHY